MKKQEIFKGMSMINGLTQKENELALEALVNFIKENVKEGIPVNINEFGVFDLKIVEATEAKEKVGTLPTNMGQVYTVPAKPEHGVPTFKPYTAFKEEVY